MVGGYLSFAGIDGKARYHATPVERRYRSRCGATSSAGWAASDASRRTDLLICAPVQFSAELAVVLLPRPPSRSRVGPDDCPVFGTPRHEKRRAGLSRGRIAVAFRKKAGLVN